ncbi:MAG: winged helix-turn-helix transcriptional regulator [Ignavibacteria bacterium]|nr:winged helix-turn-helix transcriptional regulator [Ignavibacteria bacterium]
MKLKENETTEFKKSTSLIKEALISISAILNKHGKGTLYFGIRENGEPVKNTISTKTLREIAGSITSKIDPRIYPGISIERFDDVDVVKVEFEGNYVPYSAEGRYYIRVADEDQLMNSEQLASLFEKRKSLRWDTIINEKATIKDISSAKLKEFCKLASIKATDTRDTLESLGLFKNGKLLNAALTLFSKNPFKFFSNLKLLCSVFATTSTSNILDQKEFEGDLFYLIREAEKYILKNIHIGMELNGLYRKDLPEINSEAIREVVINAFLHRDYFDPDFVSVNIFKDRIEIRNPGTLFGGLSINDIVTRNISRRRNELIADILSRAHFVERKGRGIALIKEKEPEAKFEEIGGLFIATLKRSNYKISEELVERLVDGLVENQIRIIKLIFQNPRISKRELHEVIGISTTAIDKNIEKLKNSGILKRIGPAKGGKWEIIPK